ncbi:hypothetical protein ACJMK2_038761 [Sinanodonta woodiana]|uniref:Uncharacterized protein n=1 Tax=Sinanodonta woodiana TaxID=1069815 RepID=A0ABD3WA15_SINWO
MTQTLIMATPESVRYLDMYINPVTNREDPYFTKGHHPLSDAANFELLSATKRHDSCVYLELTTDYCIYRMAINETHLFINNCGYVQRVPWFDKTHEKIEEINDFLTRQT